MKKIILILIVLFFQSAFLFGQIPASQNFLALTDISVIDVKNGRVNKDMTVVIVGDRISIIGKTSKIRIPKNSQVISCSGKFLIPGLWDMHVHFWKEERLLALFVANGVTGVRDMGGDLKRVKDWRQKTVNGEITAPRIIAASDFPLDGAPFEIPLLGLVPIVIKTPLESRTAVDNLKANGADFVKILSGLSREDYFAVAKESKKKRIPFAGHVPDSVGASEASDAGQKSLEHLFGIFLACSSRQTELRNKRAAAAANQDWAQYREIENQILDSFSAEKAYALFKKFTRNRTWQTPTLTMLKRMYLGYETDPAEDSRLDYIPSSIKNDWGNPMNDLQKVSEARKVYFERAFKRSLEIVSLMRKTNVKILAGTDTGDPFTFPGSTLHEELELLVQAGLTPMEAIQSATINPALYQKLSKTFGTIEKGKIADLVMLDANPLEDINNIRKINTVIFGGKLIPRN